MRKKIALLLALLALCLSACGYMVVEDTPVQVGSPAIRQNASGR